MVNGLDLIEKFAPLLKDFQLQNIALILFISYTLSKIICFNTLYFGIIDTLIYLIIFLIWSIGICHTSTTIEFYYKTSYRLGMDKKPSILREIKKIKISFPQTEMPLHIIISNKFIIKEYIINKLNKHINIYFDLSFKNNKLSIVSKNDSDENEEEQEIITNGSNTTIRTNINDIIDEDTITIPFLITIKKEEVNYVIRTNTYVTIKTNTKWAIITKFLVCSFFRCKNKLLIKE